MTYTDDDVTIQTKGMMYTQIENANIIADMLIMYPSMIVDIFGCQRPTITRFNVDDLVDRLDASYITYLVLKKGIK